MERKGKENKMQNYFEVYDEYCLCVNNARFFKTYDEAECASHEEEDLSAYEIDSDYAYEKRMDKLIDERS